MIPRALLILTLLSLPATLMAQQPTAPDAQQAPDAQRAPDAKAAPPPIDALPLSSIIDDAAPLDALDDAARDALLLSHGFKTGLPRGATAWHAPFLRTRDTSKQLAVIDPKSGLSILQGKKTLSRERSLRLIDAPTCQLLGIPAPALPVRIILDGTTQLLVWHIVEAPDGTQQLHVTLLKPIGSFIGKTLDRVVAIRPDRDSAWSVIGRLDILRSQKHHALRWSPLAPDGAPGDKSPQLLLWNRWEGVFRTPKPPPARPRKPAPTS